MSHPLCIHCVVIIWDGGSIFSGVLLSQYCCCTCMLVSTKACTHDLAESILVSTKPWLREMHERIVNRDIYREKEQVEIIPPKLFFLSRQEAQTLINMNLETCDSFTQTTSKTYIIFLP
ncbi:hypothetical protein GOP47_0020386 [Adiantum capillus-veneris]|uniref:Uncharacterized protein n=1 Tax=Adiantum capillus-veneris TaxID=13818 RepID=A0A9D4UCY7_ADICA|nr:hypothetical protein GOP47_0020386 [Adiantum capillus-veneris]